MQNIHLRPMQRPCTAVRIQPCAAATMFAPATGMRAPSHERSHEVCKRLVDISNSIAAVQTRTAGIQQAEGTLQQHEKVLSALEELYDESEELFHSKRGFKLSPKEQRIIEATGGSPTYGELMPSAIQAMLETLTGPQAPPGSVFMDLGSGLGRVVLQAALSNQALGFQRLAGLELSVSRLEQGEFVLERLLDQHVGEPGVLQQLQRVEFAHEDVTTSAMVQQASHVFMCSTAFGAVACRKIVDLLAASDKFQALVTSRELPRQTHLIRLGDFPAEMSWNAAGTCHVYVRRDLARTPAHLLQRFLSDGKHMCWLPGMYDRLPVSVEEPVGGYKLRFLSDNIPHINIQQ